jgi:hypothetical protein
MTTVITRLFESENLANGVADRLRWEGIPNRAVRVVEAKEGEAATDLADRLNQAGVHESTVKAYAQHMAKGHAAIVVHATHKPLGAARIVRDTMSANDTTDAGEVIEEYTTPTAPSNAPSILDDHPLFLTPRIDRKRIQDTGPISHGLGPKLLIKDRTSHSAMRGGRFMSRMFWPMPLLSRKRTSHSAMSGGGYMSRMFWPQRLVATKKRRLAVIPGGALPLSRALGFATVVTRR